MGVNIKEFVKEEMDKNYFHFWIVKKNWKFLYKGMSNLLKKNVKEEELKKFGKKCYELSIPFGEISIFLDIFSRKLNQSEKKVLEKNKNIFAKGYIETRLPKEIVHFTNQVHNNGIFVSKDKIVISRYLTYWLIEFIEHILYDKSVPETTEEKSDFGKWLSEYKGVYFNDENIRTHFANLSSSMHHTATDALYFYHKKEYFYFTLLYLDMLSFTLQLQGLLSSLFLEEKLLSLYMDPITEIPNRFQLQKDFKIFRNPTLLLVNIRDFSKINTIYGNDFGNSVLKIVAKYIETLNIIKVYRIFADEFAILVENDKVAKQVFEELDEKIILKEINYTISFYGAYKELSETALEECESALIEAKDKKLIYANKTKELIQKIKDEISLTKKLKSYLTTDKIVPYFQPIYSYNEKRVIKYECLMRIEDGNRVLNPGEFLDTLKKLPLYEEYTKSMIKKSFSYFKDKEYQFCLNFSVLDIENIYTVSFLKAMINNYPETAKRLIIELVETEAITNYEIITKFIKDIKKFGVKISLDDFGTGFSNFSQLSKLDLDYVKIDGSIVSNVLNNEKMKNVYFSILELSKKMDLKITAEFVSDKEIFEFVKNSGIDFAQGYYIGKPKPNIISE
ncbi:EAL domain-containing protein [Nitrosophilus labii]|uniref:EAL domain-containing protein n=1 Tax=Nitrosophilus labii TaxID=2706014 RepID=UPI00165749F2|nr:GGDEF domain-containing phosphodiesterase [Nitrosophilus labii]